MENLLSAPGSPKEADTRTTNDAKVCLNCGCVRTEQFCPRCGQEQGPIVPTVQQALAEIGDSVFGYDSRIVRTIQGLLKPGFLTLEYLKGRRAEYVTPFRLYLLISAIYLFLNVTLSQVQTDLTRSRSYTTVHKAHTKATSAETSVTKTPSSPTANPPAPDANATPENTAPPAASEKGVVTDGDKAVAKEDTEKVKAGQGEETLKTPRKEETTSPPDTDVTATASQKTDNPGGGIQKWAEKHETLATLLVLPLFAALLYRAYKASHPLFLAHLVFAIHIQCVSYVLAIALVKTPSLINDIVHALHIPLLPYLTSLIANLGVIAKLVVLFIYLGRAIRAVYGEENGKALRNTLFLFLMLLFLTVIQETVFGIVDDIVPGTTIARFLPD